MRLLIIGAGGHGQVVADIFLGPRTAAGLTPVGFLDDSHSVQGRTILGLPVLGTIGDLPKFPHDGVALGIGDNHQRAVVAASLPCRSKLVLAVHVSAVISSSVVLGSGTVVCAGAIVNTGSFVGDGVIINTGASVDHHTTIEDFAHLAPGVHMGGGVHIGERAFLGIGAVVLPGVRIGRSATVGAGAVVISNVPDGETVFGIPARQASTQ